jgi:hypothetical protein
MFAVFAAFAATLASAQAPATGACAYDRQRIMALDQRAFDQDRTGGWRLLARNPRCRAVAADLIRDYREAHGLSASILFWHEGQMRANAGQTERAIALFDRSRREEPDAFGWNLYVDASIAFLRGDRPALEAARNALAALPRPADFAPRDTQGRPVNMAWPPNLNVVDALAACFGRPYAMAYSCAAPVAVRPGER